MHSFLKRGSEAASNSELSVNCENTVRGRADSSDEEKREDVVMSFELVNDPTLINVLYHSATLHRIRGWPGYPQLQWSSDRSSRLFPLWRRGG
jgi:hypothetical protein